MANKILVPNGCSCSTPSVNPKTWKTPKKLDLKKDRHISYYFYDPNHEKPKQGIIKGMNKYKSLENRKDVIPCILKNELHKLINLGYTPFLKKCLKPIVKADLHPDLCIMKTFRPAHTKLK